MKPLKKNQTIYSYAREITSELIRRAGRAMETRDVDASWKVIFDALESEGRHMREASPASFVVYQAYLTAAVVFLANFPDKESAAELTELVRADLDAYAEFVVQMKGAIFEIKDQADIIACVDSVTESIRSLSAQYQK